MPDDQSEREPPCRDAPANSTHKPGDVSLGGCLVCQQLQVTKLEGDPIQSLVDRLHSRLDLPDTSGVVLGQVAGQFSHGSMPPIIICLRNNTSYGAAGIHPPRDGPPRRRCDQCISRLPAHVSWSYGDLTPRVDRLSSAARIRVSLATSGRPWNWQ